MIMEDIAENEVTISENLQIGQFKIKESAKAFSILSASLYKNKIKAIIRELSCNARDSRIAAGLSEDFYVHLPTKLEPEFFIKDEGLGLSHDEVMNLYTTYFESTKTSSNMYVGALGLGSKSPFPYTENFTVTAIKDGKEGIYSAFINEVGVPSIVCLFNGVTDSPNGVEVKFAVAEKDRHEFFNEAVAVYSWFDVKPSTNINITYHNIEVKCENYSQIQDYRYRKSIILMGGVAYEFDLSEFINPTPNIIFLFRVDIGEVDVLPSREGLQNTLKTKTAIEKLFTDITSSLEVNAHSDLDSITSTYNKLAYLNNSTVSKLQKYINDKIKIDKYSSFPKSIVIDKLEVNYGAKCYKYSYQIGKKSIKHIRNDNIVPSNYVKFIYNDLNVPIKTIKNQYKNYDCSIYIFTPYDKKIPCDTKKISTELLLGADIVLASSFYVKPKNERVITPRVKNIPGIYVLTNRQSNYKYSHYILKKTENIPLSVKYYAYLDETNEFSRNLCPIDLKSVATLLGDIESIIFLKKNSKYDVSNLIEFTSYVDEELSKLSKYYFDVRYFTEFEFNSIVSHVYKNINLIQDPELVNTAIEFKKWNEENHKIRMFSDYNKNSFKCDKTEYNIKIIENLCNKYKILNIESYYKKESDTLINLLFNTIYNHEKV